ncbi:MAG: DUF418 domain-containing protein, partial [Betaproteobacteria bacterium]
MVRDELIDALRGFALFGILAVNIQCFTAGLGAPSLGILDAQSTLADHLTVLLTAFLLEFKFYPIFSFCFGYGFAVQTRRWAARGAPPGARFTRRIDALLFMGILHGVLLWFGDILTRYAIAGYVLRRYAGHGPRRLLAATRFWAIVTVALMTVGAVLTAAESMADRPGDAPARIQAQKEEGARVIAVYTQGSYLAASMQRASDFAVVTTGFLLLIPQIMVIFLLGALAAHLGLLRHPERHRRFWTRMMRLGLWIGIPVNLVHAWQQWQASQHPWDTSQSVVSMLAGDLAPTLSLVLVATFALYGASRPGKQLVRMLAPAGRLALTLYVAQSLAMALLLNGFALGLGA